MKTRSVRHYFSIMVLIVALTPLLMMVAFKVFWYYPEERREAEALNEQFASVLAYQVQNYLDSALQQVLRVQVLDRDTHLSWQQLEQVLNSQIETNGSLNVVYVLDAKGQVNALGLPPAKSAMRQDMLGINQSLHPLFSRAHKSAGPVWSDTFLSIVDGGLSVGFATHANQRIYIGEVSLKPLHNWLKSIKNAEGQRLLLIDGKGQIIFDRHNQRAEQQTSVAQLPLVKYAMGSGHTIKGELNLDGQELIGVMIPVRNSPWFVLYANTKAATYAHANTSTVLTMALLGFALLVGACIALVISRRFSQRFGELTGLAEKVAVGESRLVWPASSVTEFARLSGSLQSMAESLHERERQLSALMGNLPGMVYRCNNDAVWSFSFMSEGAQALLGHPCEYFLQHPAHGLRMQVHPEDVDVLAQIIDRRLRLQLPWQISYRLLLDNGETKWVRDYGQGMFDEHTGQYVREGFIADISEQKNVEEAMENSETRLRAVIGNLPVVIAALDMHGVFTLSDGKGLEKLGALPGGAVGHSLFDVYRDYPPILEGFSRCVNGESTRSEVQVHGTWFDCAFEPVYANDGSISSVLMINFDISSRKQSEEEILRYSVLLSETQALAHVGGWELNVQDGTLFWSDETYWIHDLMPGEFTPTVEKALDFYVPESRPLISDAVKQAIESGKPFDMELEILTAKQVRRLVHTACKVVRANGKTSKVVGAFQDITGQKQIEAELRKHKENLEDLVEQRTTELVAARDAAQYAARAKSDFLANMSHEIRTPINAVMGLTHLALQTELDEKQRRFLSKAYSSANLLLGVVNDILDFSKIEAGKLELASEEFNIDDVLDRVTAVTSLRAQEKGLEFLIHIDPNVPQELVGDPMRLSQVLVNLCSNAIKFTESGEVVLAVYWHKLDPLGKQVALRFLVRDTGIGMSLEQQTLLFKPFSQIDTSNTRRYGGTGLGLAISRQLVEMMGGEFKLDSQLGRGSEFSFIVNFAQTASRKDHRIETPAGLTHLRGLVVDDSPNAQDILSALIGSMGYGVQCAASMEQAVWLLQQPGTTHFDFVLLNWKLPDTRPAQAMARIRLLSPKSKLYLMRPGPSSAEHADWQIGVDAILYKPLTASPLYDAIATGLGFKSLRHADTEDTAIVHTAFLRGRRVLLVEDNEFNQDVACELLASSGAAISVAGNGKQAVEMVCEGHFDAVLMDVQMPIMDGLDATRLIRTYPQYAKLPIIAVTAHATAAEKAECLAAGMNDFLSKPFYPPSLLQTLARWVEPVPNMFPMTSENTAHPDAGSIAWAASLPGIDPNIGLHFSNNKPEFYRKMLRRFFETKADVAAVLRQALQDQDDETARRHAHSIKSIAGHIGAQALAHCSAALEDGLKNAGMAFDESLLVAFERELAYVLNGLGALFIHAEPETDVAYAEFDPVLARASLTELLGLLACDVGQAVQKVDAARALMDAGALADIFTRFEQQLSVFDCMAAEQTLHEAIRQLDAYEGADHAR